MKSSVMKVCMHVASLFRTMKGLRGVSNHAVAEIRPLEAKLGHGGRKYGSGDEIGVDRN